MHESRYKILLSLILNYINKRKLLNRKLYRMRNLLRLNKKYTSEFNSR